jgi:hypothetical protein
MILDGRTLRSIPESGHRAGYYGGRRKCGSKLHIVVDRLEHLLTLLITPANDQERNQVRRLAQNVQDETRGLVDIAFVDQGYTEDQSAHEAAEQDFQLEVVKLLEAGKALYYC